ncbi:MAG TPA: hypothetical protein VMB53_01555 [Gaiellaceae bacterium]|nr:hypothetical protein [Gaiellaceae bacterium]
MRRSRRREARKVARIARLLVVLDDQARAVRPAPRRTVRLSLGARL